jgi:hypothetical protein
VDKPALAQVATTGDYDDLLNKPVIPVVPTLAAVATSGDYEDLDNKPNIPSISGLAEDDLSNVILPTADAGKYLKIAANGSIEYDTPSAGSAHLEVINQKDACSKLHVGDVIRVMFEMDRIKGIATDWSTAPTQVGWDGTGNFNQRVAIDFYVRTVQSGEYPNVYVYTDAVKYVLYGKDIVHTGGVVTCLPEVVIKGFNFNGTGEVKGNLNMDHFVFNGGGIVTASSQNETSHYQYDFNFLRIYDASN